MQESHRSLFRERLKVLECRMYFDTSIGDLPPTLVYEAGPPALSALSSAS